MPQFRRPRWPNPQDSCGQEILNLILTRKRAWFASGLALEKYSTDLEPNLLAVLNSIGLERGEIYVRLYMIGRVETTSEPTIMVCCMNEGIRSRVKNELRANPTLRSCREFLIHGIPHPLEQMRPARPLAGTSDSWDRYQAECESTSPLDDVFSQTTSLSLGRRLSKPQNDKEATFWATGGVFLQIDGAYFQLTAEHSSNDIYEDQDDLHVPETDMDPDNYSINGSDDDEIIEESPITFDVLSKGSLTPRRSSISQRSFSINPSENSIWDNESSHADDWTGQEVTRSDLGTSPNRNSQIRGNFADMPHLKATKKVGVISIRSSRGSSPGLDYALVLTPPPKVSDSINNLEIAIGDTTRLLKIRNFDSMPPGRKSIVVAGEAGSIRTGAHLPGRTLFKRADQNSFQSLQIVRLNDSEFNFGDSGGAVLDQESGAFYGHIVSGCPGTGIAYLVPAVEVFDDLASMGFHAIMASCDSEINLAAIVRPHSWWTGNYLVPKSPSRDASTQTDNALLPTPPLSQIGSDIDLPQRGITQYLSPLELEYESFAPSWPCFNGPERSTLIALFNDRMLDDIRNKHANDMWAMFYDYDATSSSHKIHKVQDFCRMATLDSLETNATERSTIWLDQRESRSHQPRSFLGILTARELFEQMSLKRFGESGHLDADRRILFVQNPDPYSILCLAMTSSRAEREGLAEAIYKHVTFRPYFGVAIRSPGLRTFNLHFQIPTFVLRYRKGNSNGDSGTDEIRQSIDLSFLFPSTRRTHDASTPQSLDERHISLLVTGFDEARWTAYCFADSHLDGEESLRALADYTDRELLTDPVSCGKLPLGALWDPREYFLAILRIRLRQFDNEWARTVQFLDQAIANQLSQESDRRMRGSPFQDNKLESQIRLAHTEALITQLLHTISGTIESWERFQEDQLDSYFDGLQTRPSFPFDACRQDMLKAIGNVRNYEDSLHSMKSLCQVKYSPVWRYQKTGKFRQFKAGQPKIDQDLEIEAGSPHPSRLLERLASQKSESLGAGIMHLIRSKFHRRERDAAMDLNLPHRGEARSHGPHDIELNNIKCPPVP